MSPELDQPALVHRTTCRVCGGTDLEQILSLGPTPLANAFLTSADEFVQEQSYPLVLYFCGQCSLLQLLDVVDPEVLFRHYLYVTGTSTTMAAHNVAYARTLVDLLGLVPHAISWSRWRATTAACCACFQRSGVRVRSASSRRATRRCWRSRPGSRRSTSSSPAEPRSDSATERPGARPWWPTTCWPTSTTPGLPPRLPRTCCDRGWPHHVEVPYRRRSLDRLEYDTVYHEHLSLLLGLGAPQRCATAWTCASVRIDRVPVHGGSLRLYLSRSRRQRIDGAGARRSMADERRAGLTTVDALSRFAADVRAQPRGPASGCSSIWRPRASRVAGYGAPAKGNTLLNYCGIDTRLLPFTVDKNPLKVGLFTPGSTSPVLPCTTLATSGGPTTC